MKTSFWDDNWLGQRSLKQLFPDICNLNQQGAYVGEIWSNQGGILLTEECYMTGKLIG